MFNLLINLIRVNQDLKDAKNQNELIFFTTRKKELINNKIWFAIFSEIIRIQLYKPMYIPVFLILMMIKLWSAKFHFS
jgi:hypothetical protein